MSLINKIIGVPTQPTFDLNALTKQEIELLINLIKQSHFQGDSLEILYNLVLKLQQQYVSLDK
jgi:hypothetical protein